jgi:zinc transporter ZupT
MWPAIAMSTLGALVTGAGVYAVRNHEPWTRRNRTYFISFAAGVLLAASLLHLIPESLSRNAAAPSGVLAGYLLLHLLNRFVVARVCDKYDAVDYRLGIVALLGIAFHSFLDGLIYAVGFAAGELTGFLIAPGLILHEFPEGVVTYSLLVCSGFAERRALWLTLAAAALSTPLGTILSIPLVGLLSAPLLGLLLGFSAGSLLYVAATHLLPEAERAPARFGLGALAAGIVVALAIARADAG